MLGQEAFRVLESYPVEIVDLSGQSARQALANCKDAVASNRIDALLAVGGDGMVHLGVDAVAGTGLPLGIVAVGSGNDIAREFRLPILNVSNSIHQVMSSLFGERSRATDVMEITGSHGTTHALAVLSAGIDAAINSRTNLLNWPKGNLRYLRATGEELANYQTYGVRIEIDGVAHAGPATLISVANTRFVGGGMNIAPTARTNDGQLDVVVAYVPNVRTVASLLPLVYLGKHVASPLVHVIRGRHIRICEDRQMGGPAPLAMADGEEIGHLPLDIRCLAGGLELLV